jgi:hypothetical protein
MSWTGSYDVPTISNGDGEKPALPESRVRDGWQGHAIFRKLEYDDRDAEIARANIDYQIDGGLPYSVDVMKNAGRGEDANVNFREARAEDDLAQTPFIEMTTISPTLWRISVNSGGTDDDRVSWGRTMSERFTQMVRRWDDFDYYRIKLSQQFTRHGAGFAYWEDEIDWRWRADGFNAFKLPRNIESRASAIPYCVCKRSMSVTELYAFIRNEKVAKEVGRWNVEAVKMALRYAAVSNSRPLYSYAWEDFQREIKENDVEFGVRAEQVQLYHEWVTEYDGTVSHYIGLQDGIAMMDDKIEKPSSDNNRNSDAKSNMVGNGFLYAHRCRFPTFGSAIVPFFYAIGTHATVHTIRGQGEMNFGPISISNRAMCNLIDTAKASSMILLQAESPADAENTAYIQMGGFMILSGHTKVQPNAMPDVSSRLLPVLNEMRGLRQQVSPNSSAQPPQTGKSKQPETKYGIQAKQNRGGALSSAMLTQWFGPFGRLGREMLRRALNPDLKENMPGGKEAFEFRLACMKDGVPAHVLNDFAKLDVEAVRVIGNGSPEQRQYAAEQVLELSDKGFDEYGKRKALLDATGAIPGVDWQAAQDYVGPLEPRKPIDDQIANGENSLFTLGGNAKVTGEQNHWVHCQVHEQLVTQFVEAFNQGQIDGQKLVTVIKPALDNMLAHSEILSKEKAFEKQSAQVRKFIQNNNGVLEQQENKLIAQMQKQQAEQQQGGGEMSAEAQQKMQLHQMEIQKRQQDLQMRKEEFLAKLQMMNQEAKARQSLADLEAARAISERSAELAAQPLN